MRRNLLNFIGNHLYGVDVMLTVGLGEEDGVIVALGVAVTVSNSLPPVTITISNSLSELRFDESTVTSSKVGFNTSFILFTISSKSVRAVIVVVRVVNFSALAVLILSALYPVPSRAFTTIPA